MQACCLLNYLCEITGNNGIHIYLSGCNCGSGFEQKYWRIDGFGGRKLRIAGFAYPYSPHSGLPERANSSQQEKTLYSLKVTREFTAYLLQGKGKPYASNFVPDGALKRRSLRGVPPPLQGSEKD